MVATGADLVTESLQRPLSSAQIGLARGPKCGYEFKEKEDYRRRVWALIAQHVPEVTQARVAFLPGIEGLDIPVALGLGFQARNLIAIEEERGRFQALIMQRRLPWKLTYPNVDLRFGSAGEVARTLKKASVDAAVLDYCGCFGVPVIKDIQGWRESGALKPHSLVAVTIQRGREKPEASAVLAVLEKHKDLPFSSDLDVRLRVVASELFGAQKVALIGQGKYQSTVPMAWALFKSYAYQEEAFAAQLVTLFHYKLFRVRRSREIVTSNGHDDGEVRLHEAYKQMLDRSGLPIKQLIRFGSARTMFKVIGLVKKDLAEWRPFCNGCGAFASVIQCHPYANTSLDEPAPWEFSCMNCAPDAYWFSLRDLCDRRELRSVDKHVLSKRWHDRDSWSYLTLPFRVGSVTRDMFPVE